MDEAEALLPVEKGGLKPPHFERVIVAERRQFLLEQVESRPSCSSPVISLLSANYLPVILLFRARRRFSINRLKTNGFWEKSRPRIAPNSEKNGDNREKQGANRAMRRVNQTGECRAPVCRLANPSTPPPALESAHWHARLSTGCGPRL